MVKEIKELVEFLKAAGVEADLEERNKNGYITYVIRVPAESAFIHEVEFDIGERYSDDREFASFYFSGKDSCVWVWITNYSQYMNIRAVAYRGRCVNYPSGLKMANKKAFGMLSRYVAGAGISYVLISDEEREKPYISIHIDAVDAEKLTEEDKKVFREELSEKNDV